MMKQKLKRLLGKRAVGLIKILCVNIQFLKYNLSDIIRGLHLRNKRLIYLHTPTHGNVGDLAIAVATRAWLKERFPDTSIIEFTYSPLTRFVQSVFKWVISTSDILLLHGGGNLGNWYIDEERYRRYIIDNFAENKILVLPQSIYFSDTEDGNKEKEETARVYNKCNDLTVIVRDEYSMTAAKEIFTCKLLLSPDMVLGYQAKLNKSKRSGIIVCLRNDKEDIYTNDEKAMLINQLEQLSNMEIIIQDTAIGKRVRKQKRVEIVNSFLNAYAASCVVVANRFHAGIFAFLTKTPCVLLPSADSKIRGGYKWLKECGNIIMAESIDEVPSLASDLIGKTANPVSFNNEFSRLFNLIDR